MRHTSGNEFVKKNQQRELAKQGDIFVASRTHTSPPGSSIYTPEEPRLHTRLPEQASTIAAPEAKPVILPKPLTTAMTRNEKLRFLAIRSLGNFLVLLSIYGVLATFGSALYYEVYFKVSQMRGVHFSIETPTGRFDSVNTNSQGFAPGFGDIIAGAQQQVLIPPDTQFSILIPKIAATARVWPNVDPLDEKDFLPKLQNGVAHAKGSVFPGMEGNVYLFAHSTDNFWDVGRYNAVFYLLKDLTPGDDVAVYFENTRYNYKVERTVIKDPSDVDLLVNSQIPGQEQLILQTCWPPGTTWKRLFVIATPQK
ncbi:MAG: sortase [Patescibacteria group bacterium]